MIRLLVPLLIFSSVLTADCARAGNLTAPDWSGTVMAIDYSPSGILTFAALNAGVPEARLRADLERLSVLTSRIRTYSSAANLAPLFPIARKLGLKITLGLWLGRSHEVNDIEIARGLALIAANSDMVDRVYVGNEVLLRGDLTVDELISNIKRVKQALADAKIPVSTAENWGEWLRRPELADACDFIAVHILPYWDGIAVEEAVPYVGQRATELQQAYPGKPIVMAEIGWPSDGPPRNAAILSLTNEAYFIRHFLPYAAAQDYDYYLLEGFDQPWKKILEGTIGASWGLFDASGRMKFDLTGPLPTSGPRPPMAP